MKQEQFETNINASAAKVWQTLWNDATYMQWTSAFCNGSYAKSDWKQGSRIQFLSPNGGGMYSEIVVLESNNKMHFKHIGEIKDYQEQPLDEKTSLWTGAKENYELTESNGQTRVVVTVDITEESAPYFTDVFPKALAILKELSEKNYISVSTSVNATIDTVWDCWTKPEHITKWCNASDDWHTSKASNDLKVDGKFSSTMAAKDGSMSFDFEGTYFDVKKNEKISYKIVDGRNVYIIFAPIENQIKIVETFEAESQNPEEMQQAGWQNIIDSFKKYVESLN